MFRSLFNVITKGTAKKFFSTALQDSTGQKLTFLGLHIKVSILSSIFKSFFLEDKKLGIMLPNTVAFPVVFFALNTLGKIPAIFNFKSTTKSIISSAKTAGIKKILTSKKFEEKAGLAPLVEELKNSEIQIIYIEDILAQVGAFKKIVCALHSFVSPNVLINPEDPALILFTSGSEGEPKAVLLSTINILSNVEQIKERMAHISEKDVFFSSLPFFHSFGLTAGLLFPMYIKAKIAIYHSPLDYKQIPKKVKETKSTVLFSTNTFLANYGQNATKEDFASLKYLVGGAEKMQQETLDFYKDKFDLKIYEGYGLTEASPVISVETPALHKNTSVGKPLKDIEIRIENIDGYENGGKLFVKGPNIMLGYYLPSEPEKLVKPNNGWHDTGDIVHCDPDSYLYIRGRLKRFAKIGGEMISLGAIESVISNKFKEHNHVASAVPDKAKGEKIILVTTQKDLQIQDINALFQKENMNNLMLPRQILFVDEIPTLPNGKTDFVSINKFVETKLKEL